jgi:drug/metabolite transporter (DMT)-like permease
MTNQSKAYFYAALAVVFWSTAASAFKLTLRVISNFELLLYSTFFSALAFLLVLVFQGRLSEIGRFRPREYFNSAVLGFLNPFLYYFVLFSAYQMLPAQEALPLNLTWPIVLVLLSIPVLGHRLSFASVLAFAISFLGVLVIATRGDLASFRLSNPVGVALAVASSVVWSLYWIGNVKDKRGEVPKLFLNFSFGFLYCLAAGVVTGGLQFVPLSGLIGSIYIGLFEMGFTYIFWMKALRYSTSPGKVSILMYIVPFTSITLIALVVGESLMISSVLGAVLIISGIVIEKRLEKRPFAR